MNKSSFQKNIYSILLRNTEKIFSAQSEQGCMKRRVKLFLGNIFLNLDLEIFGPSHSRYVPLKAELPLLSSNCKGEAWLPRSHFKRENLESKIV